MRKAWSVVVGLTLVALLLGTAGCVPGTNPFGETFKSGSTAAISAAIHQPTGISVTGQGRVKVKPDIAILQLGIEAEAEKVVEAYAQASEAMNKVIEALKDKGIAEEDIQTRYFSIYQERRKIVLKAPPPAPKTAPVEEVEEKAALFRVSNMITVKVRKLEDVSSIIEAAIEAGGDLIRFQGVSFSIEDPKPYQIEARERAIADAKAKAEQIAELAGVTLGKPIYISEGYTPSPWRGLAAVPVPAAPPPMPILPGEREISVSITVTFAIE